MGIQYTNFGVGIKYASKIRVLKEMISFGYFGNRMEAPSNMEMTNEDEQEIKT